jgi:Ca-activated chloride channel family protein
MKHLPVWMRWWMGAVVVMAAGALAADETKPPNEAPAAGLMVHAANAPEALLPATRSEIEIEVAGLVAHARVVQHYRNPGSQFLEGIYRLPLPADSAVYAMRIVLDGRVIEGEIREREAARIEYAAARSAGMATALVEQQKLDLFKTSVANIPPHAEVRIEIEYFQTIAWHDGRFGLVLPLTLRPRYGDRAEDDFAALIDPTTPMLRSAGLTLPLSIRVQLTPGIAVQPPESPSHAVRVQPFANRYEVTLAGEAVPADRDFVLTWRPLPGTAPSFASFAETVDGAQYLSVLVVPPPQRGPRLPRELIIVLDSSGSMSGAAFTGAQHAAQFALSTLTAGDYFNVIDFDSSATALAPVSLPAQAADRQRASDFIASREADGGTEIAGALALAMGLPAIPQRLRQLVFITDGAVGNEADIYQSIAAADSAARLFMVGIGDAPNRAFLRRAAELGHGVATVIESTAAIDSDLSALFRQIDTPQLTDLQIDWPSNAESYPRQLPDLYPGEPLWLTTRLDPGAKAIRSTLGVKATSASGGLNITLPLAHATAANGLAKIWARRKIQSLEDGLTLGDDAEQVRNEVLATALTHHLVSRYTSFVAVEKVLRRDDQAALVRADFANPAPADAIAFGNTALGWRAQLLYGLMLLMAATLIGWRAR